jgi:predicted amidohydrolase
MRVAGIQLEIAWEDPSENLKRVEPAIAAAAADEARLVVLPEMFASGFTMAAGEMAARADDIRDALAASARRHGIWLLGGYAEPGDVRPYNACSLMSPAGVEVIHYRKIHPFSLAREHEHYAAGTEISTAEVEGVRVTPTICYDLRFTEIYRATATETDLFAVLANWPDRRSHSWRTLLAARAIDCQAWVIGVNRVGQDGNGVTHRGDSAIVDPMGEVVESLAWTEGVVAADVDPGRVRELRDRFSFLADRRPEVYGALERRGERDTGTRETGGESS